MNLVCAFVSCVQFSLTLTATRDKPENEDTKMTSLDYIFSNESWSILLICLTQDLPFFLFRLVVLLKYYNPNDHNYTKFFFLLKSFILVLLEIYRLFILLKEECSRKNKIDKE